MPPVARAFVKAALVYLVFAFSLGALMMLDRWLSVGRWLRELYLSQLHLMLVGWITQLAIGVAYWMFPRFLREQNRLPRGSDSLSWAIFYTLNVGLVLRFVAEPFFQLSRQSWLGALMTLAGVLQAMAVVGFVRLIWGRIRAMEPSVRP